MGYAIKDEEGNFAHGSSIKKIGKEFYYLPYSSLKDGCTVYTNKIRAEQALKKLRIHNQLGGLGHSFTIVEI